jgi:hypothetical protein
VQAGRVESFKRIGNNPDIKKGNVMNKSFRKMVWLFFLAFTIALPAMAQTPVIEYGQPDELRGVTKVFIGIDAPQRDVVAREIKKQLPNLEIVSRPDESDIHLLYSLKETRGGRTEGVGTVVKFIGSNHARALYSFKDELSPIYEQHSTKSYGIDHIMPLRFAREFVKAYKKANV